jgi:hypothetical protein
MFGKTLGVCSEDHSEAMNITADKIQGLNVKISAIYMQILRFTELSRCATAVVKITKHSSYNLLSNILHE